MQTPDEETARAALRRAYDELQEATAAISAIEESIAAGSNHTIIAATVEDLDEGELVYRVPTPHILQALRQWQQLARIAKIEAEKTLEGL